MQCQAATDLDDVVRDHPKANPALHTFEPSIPTAIQSVASLQHANAAFASGPPALPRFEPTRFLPETVCMKVSGHKTRNVFDRYNITSERDLEDAAKKIELSYRQAKTEENAQGTQQEEPVTIQ